MDCIKPWPSECGSGVQCESVKAWHQGRLTYPMPDSFAPPVLNVCRCLDTPRAGNVQRHHKGEQCQICSGTLPCDREPASWLASNICLEASGERSRARLSSEPGAPAQPCAMSERAGNAGVWLPGAESSGCEQAQLPGWQQAQCGASITVSSSITCAQTGSTIRHAHTAPGRARRSSMRMTKDVFM